MYGGGGAGGRQNVTKVIFRRNVSKLRTSDALASYVAQLTKDELEKLYHVYEIDFRMFGYSWP